MKRSNFQPARLIDTSDEAARRQVYNKDNSVNCQDRKAKIYYFFPWLRALHLSTKIGQKTYVCPSILNSF